MRGARKEGYSRRHRFAAQGSFGPVLRGPRKLKGRLAILHVIPGRSESSRLGIALTRKLVPAATDRNRVKRALRETFRRHAAKGCGMDCVVTLRERFKPGDEAAIAGEVRGFLDRLQPPRPE